MLSFFDVLEPYKIELLLYIEQNIEQTITNGKLTITNKFMDYT